MSREYDLKCCIVSLERARDYAVSAGLDHHFVSEVEHLMATAQANKEEAAEKVMMEIK